MMPTEHPKAQSLDEIQNTLLFHFRQILIFELLRYLDARLQDRGIKSGPSTDLMDLANELYYSKGIRHGRINKSASKTWQAFHDQFIKEMGKKRSFFSLGAKSSMLEPVESLLMLLRSINGRKIGTELESIAEKYKGHKLGKLAEKVIIANNKLADDTEEAFQAACLIEKEKKESFKAKLAQAQELYKLELEKFTESRRASFSSSDETIVSDGEERVASPSNSAVSVTSASSEEMSDDELVLPVHAKNVIDSFTNESMKVEIESTPHKVNSRPYNTSSVIKECTDAAKVMSTVASVAIF